MLGHRFYKVFMVTWSQSKIIISPYIALISPTFAMFTSHLPLVPKGVPRHAHWFTSLILWLVSPVFIDRFAVDHLIICIQDHVSPDNRTLSYVLLG